VIDAERAMIIASETEPQRAPASGAFRRLLATWFFRPPAGSLKTVPPAVRAVNFLAALTLILVALWFSLARMDYHWNWPLVFRRWKFFTDGWLMTLAMSSVALVGSTLVGMCFAFAGRARFLPLRFVSKIYVELVRGTPLLVQIFIAYYGVANALRIGNGYLVGGVTLSIFGGAYISEIIRAGIESIGRSQLDSARAIGLTPAQTYRYVIFPQAIRQILPPLAVQFVALIKDSSLLSVVAINEFTFQAKMVSDNTYSPLEAYLPLAAGYLLLTLPISFLTRHLEERHRFET